MGHWYEKDGTPKHWQEDGKDTTLRHARKQELYPSVTTIGGIKYKFGLERWKIETVCKYALTQTDKDVKVVVKEAFEELDQQAQDGTDIHDVLEKWFSPDIGHGIDFDSAYPGMCAAVQVCIEIGADVDMLDGSFKTETRFCDTEHGYAGMCDLHNEHWVIDFKTKDTVDDKTKGWKEQAEQLAAYAHGLGYPDARLANVFISREDPTQVVWYEHKDPWAWERFRHALMMWQVENKYGPYFEQLGK